MTIKVIGPGDSRYHANVINVCSNSDALWKQLSPFLMGPVKLYGNHRAIRMENAWQYAKVYARHVDANGEPTHLYYKWAIEGWANDRAVRYPMGKGAIPLYSLWDGEKLDYISARKNIYIPLYSKLAIDTAAYKELERMYEEGKDITLFDFDGYDNTRFNLNMEQVLNNPNKKMGHAFVLKMMLEGMI